MSWLAPSGGRREGRVWELHGTECEFAIQYLKGRNVGPLDLMVFDPEQGGADHDFVVIGRGKNSQWNKLSTWGKDAVICDPWFPLYPDPKFNRRAYPASEAVLRMSGYLPAGERTLSRGFGGRKTSSPPRGGPLRPNRGARKAQNQCGDSPSGGPAPPRIGLRRRGMAILPRRAARCIDRGRAPLSSVLRVPRKVALARRGSGFRPPDASSRAPHPGCGRYGSVNSWGVVIRESESSIPRVRAPEREPMGYARTPNDLA